jgi:hypothetical protein
MKRIMYAGGSFMTGDRIADAVLDYAAVLARAGSADHLRVPGLGVDDRWHVYDVLIGPASQLLAEDVDTLIEDVGDESFLADLRARSGAVESGA